LDHATPQVVKLHEVIDPPGAPHMMLIMEYMERGPVMETATQTGFMSFPERIARDFFRQALAGLDYLHYNNVVHGDLKVGGSGAG
jgi:calcium/calmodulin-dependent protein kinase kinase 2